jgi:Subtilase family
MRRPALSASLFTLLALALVSPLAFAPLTADAANAPAYDYSDVYTPGQTLRDGMLVADRLIVFFEPGSVPTLTLAKTGEPLSGQLPLDRLSQQFGVRTFERLFAELPQRLKAAQPAERARVFAVDFDGEANRLADVAAAYVALPSVEHVEPVGIHFMHANLPNDPSLGQQWWLRSPTAGGADIRALAAWYHSTGSADVIICDADSGVDWKHPDLGGSGPDYSDGVIWTNSTELGGVAGVDDDGNGKIDDFRGWDFVNVSSGAQSPPQDIINPDNDPMDYGSHGTWVAGCMSAITNNGIGITSTNWTAKIMACRIGWTQAVSLQGVVRMDFAAQAMDYARINGADVYNASWGSSASGGLGTATNLAINNGMIVVTSAGNSNDEIASYLAARSDVVSVAATGTTDSKAGFSSYGGWVDISAPGVSIFTTGFDRSSSGAAQHTYGAPDGTSFSSPIVAGAFAFAKAANPTFNRTQLVDFVLAAVDDIDSSNSAYIGKLGSGRLNLAKMFDNPMWLVPDQLPTLLDAINTAEVGDTVAVVGATVLSERVLLQAKGVKVLGGWDAGFTTRDPVNNPAILDPVSGAGSTVTALAGVDSTAVLDGFVVRGGKAGFFSFQPVDGRYGGGIVIRNASPVLRNIRVEGCVAGLSNEFGAGGAVAVLGGSPLFEDCEFTGNSAMNGSAIYVHQGTPTFRNVNIHDNTNYPLGVLGTPVGGAVYVLNVPTQSPGASARLEKKAAGAVTIDGGAISGHTVAGSGGAVYASNAVVDLSNLTIENNTAGDSGGALYLSGGSYAGSGNVIRNNTSSGVGFTSGGGLYANAAAVSIDGSRYESNIATLTGAGINVAAPPSLSITNSFFLSHTGGILGTAVALNGIPAGAAFDGNTVANNSGASAGGNGLYLTGTGNLSVSNNIFAFNGGGGGTSLADGVDCAGPTATFSCNTAFGNTAANYGGCPDPTGTNGNIAVDPGFCDLLGGDFTISSSSPAASGQTGCGRMGAGAEICTPTAVDDGPALPRVLALNQNTPNPFNPITTIAFELPQPGAVSLRVFDLRGRSVRLLRDENLPAGRYRSTWDGRDDGGRSVASGVYFYELRTGGERLVRKMGLLK